jgi:hypothetical protein
VGICLDVGDDIHGHLGADGCLSVIRFKTWKKYTGIKERLIFGVWQEKRRVYRNLHILVSKEEVEDLRAFIA